ncbi:MAG: NUDIX domain-containing protein, partial [Anaerolineales bacterium]
MGDSGPLQTALRGACEEVGIPPAAVHPLGILDPVDTSSGFRIWPVAGIIRPPVDPRPSSPEVAEGFWIPLDWLAAEGRWEWRTVDVVENHNSVRENESQVIARSEAT